MYAYIHLWKVLSKPQSMSLTLALRAHFYFGTTLIPFRQMYACVHVASIHSYLYYCITSTSTRTSASSSTTTNSTSTSINSNTSTSSVGDQVFEKNSLLNGTYMHVYIHIWKALSKSQSMSLALALQAPPPPFFNAAYRILTNVCLCTCRIYTCIEIYLYYCLTV